MTDHFEKTWNTYVSAWGAGGVEAKRALMAECLAPDCAYNDPLTRRTGHEDLLAYMLELHEQQPGAHFRVKHFRAHNNQSIACWDLLAADGAFVTDGISYGRYNADGMLDRMTGFFDPGA
ncbi:hypothetical protein AcidC75_25830 [Acidisoma sp. C75]